MKAIAMGLILGIITFLMIVPMTRPLQPKWEELYNEIEVREVSAEEAPTSDTITIGNRSYVPYKRLSHDENMPKEILQFLQRFEEKNHVTVKDWKLLQNTNSVYGIWIDHESRAEAEAAEFSDI